MSVPRLGRFNFTDQRSKFLGDWNLEPTSKSSDYAALEEVATLLRDTEVPVAFPTETVYGLGADATRSAAVQGIYRAKQRPSDNPLIVHISSLLQLRKLLCKNYQSGSDDDPIPAIYQTLIQKFWPGPLTILLPLPRNSPFAPEVTAGLPTVGIRMPSSYLALALIHMAGIPLAAPSANASTRPSPTTAAHVLHDLDGRINLIIDGGPCQVGVESTVVDGLHSPPLILRPGGVSLEMLRECPGWENVEVGYQDRAQKDVPRAPGMKYKHYSPRARVLLYRGALKPSSLRRYAVDSDCVGIMRTSDRPSELVESHDSLLEQDHENGDGSVGIVPTAQRSYIRLDKTDEHSLTLWTVNLGPEVALIAKGLFSALRDLDDKGVGTIFVECPDEGTGDAAAAVMNRLNKAAEREIEPPTIDQQ